MISLSENEKLIDLINQKELFLFDMDGTVYLDNEPIDGSIEFIKKITKNGKKVFFFTNNSSKSRNDYVLKLKMMGLNVKKEDVITSNQVAAHYINEHHKGARVLYLGNFPASQEMKEYGINVIPAYEKNIAQKVDIALMAYDTAINYEKIKVFTYFLNKGVRYIVTHPDINCPSTIGGIPDVGAFMELFAASTGRYPDKILGKPSVEVLDFAMKLGDCSKEKTIFFGDRMYTDIRMAVNNHITSVLVLSGETQIGDLEKYDYAPDFIIESIKSLSTL
ncbi:MAG TPA: HAD-IIA family hydrolase [Thermotogota bacterium]|nr:HAD-IIA family hydrolase [Thermotogota bacterium]HPJ87864.1 HAD-IIA family hydrolase [Thermotogota bacterium]HPR94957.1 HAD-IIA family hydrolase [Thermotogota bacterium]